MLAVFVFSVLTFSNNISFAQQKDCLNIGSDLQVGSRDSSTKGDVTELQTYLNKIGYLDSEPTGYFGNATKKAVIAFQKSQGLYSIGYVGKATRAIINNVACLTAGSDNNIASDPKTSYIVSYDLNGTTGSTLLSQTIASGKSISIPKYFPIRRGYEFKGWLTYAYTCSYGQSCLASGYIQAGSDFYPTSNTTLYAAWVATVDQTYFKTSDSSASLTVVSPNGNEIFTEGQQISVKWTYVGLSASSTDISSGISLAVYGANNNSLGTTGVQHYAITTNASGMATITLPTIASLQQTNPILFQNAVPGKHFKIVIGSTVSATQAYINDYSDEFFTISSASTTVAQSCSNGSTTGSCTPSVTVVSPNGNEMFTEGQKIAVKWTSNNIPGSNIDISSGISMRVFDANNNSLGTTGLVHESTPANSSGIATVTLPTIASLQASSLFQNAVAGKHFKITIGATPANSPFVYDYSDDYFTISSATPTTHTCPDGSVIPLTLVCPSSGDVDSIPAPINLKTSSITSSAISVTWTNQASYSACYMYYGTDSNTVSRFTGEGTLTTRCSAGNMTNLSPNTTYYFKVKGKLNGSYSPWSDILKVRTIGLTSSDDTTGDVYIDTSTSKTIKSTTTLSPTVYGVGSYQFNRSLTAGMHGDDVKMLQKFLNTQGYKVDLSGYFGENTKKALISFQNAHKEEILDKAGIDQGTGDFFFNTLNFVNDLLLNSTTINLNN